MKKNPFVSIIMPTFNSEKTIRMALESIKKQNYDRNSIEILVVDGRSEDKTKLIAEEYGCRFFDNYKIQQEYAKHIGILKAKGKFAIFLDSDEVLGNDTAIRDRIDILTNYPYIKVVQSGGYKKPDKYSAINDYINNFSDPITFFMNGISSESDLFIKSCKRKYKTFKDFSNFTEFEFRKNDVLPTVDMCAGNTIDLKYFKDLLKDSIKNDKIIPKIFYILIKNTNKTAILKNDFIIHYSADSYKKFLDKIKWRVVVNVHYKEIPGTGFSNREQFQPTWYKLKKYFFIPFAFSLIIPLLISIYHSMSRKKLILLIHFPLTVYTASIILHQYFLKLIGIKPILKPYGSEQKE